MSEKKDDSGIKAAANPSQEIQKLQTDMEDLQEFNKQIWPEIKARLDTIENRFDDLIEVLIQAGTIERKSRE